MGRPKKEQIEPAPRITKAGAELRAYIDKHYGSIPAFAEVTGVDRNTVQRVINGSRWQHVSVDFALAVHEATDGEVDWRGFASKTAVPVPSAA